MTRSDGLATRLVLRFLLCVILSEYYHKEPIYETKECTHCWRMYQTDRVCTEMHWVRNMLQLHKQFGSEKRVRSKSSSLAKITHLPVGTIRASCTRTAASGIVLARLARRPPT